MTEPVAWQDGGDPVPIGWEVEAMPGELLPVRAIKLDYVAHTLTIVWVEDGTPWSQVFHC